MSQSLVWKGDRLKLLLECSTDAELVQNFPGYKLESLRRIQRERRGNKKVDDTIKNDIKLKSANLDLSILRRKYGELLKQVNLQEKIVQLCTETLEALPTVPAPGPVKLDKTKTVESVVLVGSCWHIGEVVNKAEMGGLNEYNFETFIKRFQFLIDKTISFTTDNMRNHQFEELHILLTGDMVSGVIHEELRETNDLNIVEQATIGALITAQGFLELARVFPKVVVTCVVGNHGRVQEKYYFKHKQQVSWDYIFYTNLALLLRDQKNISFNIPLSFWAGVTIQGHNFLTMHGDLIKSWGSIPFYGLNREVSKWVEINATMGKFFKYFVGSHFHTKAVIQSPMGERILNGSLKGGDEYAAGLGLYGDPVQLLFGMHKKYGKTWEVTLNAKFADQNKIRYHYDRSIPISLQKI